MALAGQNSQVTDLTVQGQLAGGVPAAAASQSEGQGGEPLPTIDAMQKRLNGMGHAFDKLNGAVQQLTQMMEKGVPAQGASAGKPATVKMEGAAGLEALSQQIKEQKEQAHSIMVRSSILSTMIENGVPEALAKKTLHAMQNEGKYEVNDVGEVTVNDGTGARSAGDFVRLILQRDDWRGLVPAKPGAKPMPRGVAAPVGAGVSAIQPNENGVFSASAVRAAMGT